MLLSAPKRLPDVWLLAADRLPALTTATLAEQPIPAGLSADRALSGGCGTTDLLGRLVADQRAGLNATVIVENKPGAATASAPNRWQGRSPMATLLMATSDACHQQDSSSTGSWLTIGEGFYADRAGGRRAVRLIINPQLPAKTLSEFIAYAKSSPDWPMARPATAITTSRRRNAEVGSGHRYPPCAVSRQRTGDARCDRGDTFTFMIVDLQPALQQIREGQDQVLGVLP